ncbi:MAG: hypothetical protein ACPG4T_23260, partial [Nannocystaceae bacterium]
MTALPHLHEAPELAQWASLWQDSDANQPKPRTKGWRHWTRRRRVVAELVLAAAALVAPLLVSTPCVPIIAATWVCVPLWLYQVVHGTGPQRPHTWMMPTSAFCEVQMPPRIRARERMGWIVWMLCVATALCWAHGGLEFNKLGVDFVATGHASSWALSLGLLTAVCLRVVLARRGFSRELSHLRQAQDLDLPASENAGQVHA